MTVTIHEELSKDDLLADTSITSSSSSIEKNNLDGVIPKIFTPLSSPGKSYQSQASLRNGLSPSPSIQDFSKRRRFDERLQSRVSSLTTFQRQLKNTRPIRPRQLTQTSISSSFLTHETPESMKWLKLSKLSSKIYERDFFLSYGESVCIVPEESFLCIGTSKGYVLVFDYQQNLQFYLGDGTKAIECGPLSTLALSLDSTYLASGYDSGDIFIWDLSKKSSPIIHIPPIDSMDIRMSQTVGHLTGSKIQQLMFVGTRHTAIISTDTSGLMISHTGGRRFLSYYINSKIILGQMRSMSNMDFQSTILSWSCLHMGTNKQLTDDIGVMAILTPTVLIVISTIPNIQTHFKVGKPKVMKGSLGVSGFVSWYPAIVNKEEGRSTYPLLAYCWSNVLTIFEVVSESIRDHDGNDTVMLKFENKKRWVCEEGIASIQWINSKVIGILTTSQKLVILNKETMKVACNIDVVTRYIKSTVLYPRNSGLMESSYGNSFKVYKNRIFMLGRYELFIGTLTNWADSIFDTLTDGYYIEALGKAKIFYEGSCDLAVVGLPTDNIVRHKLLYNYITELLESSLNYLFADETLLETDDSGRWNFLSNFLSTSFDVLVLLNASLEVYENIYEKYNANGFIDLYFEVLEEYIMDKLIVSLPPVVLKAMVEFYINIGRGESLEELICLLDIHQLDIDLTISLCRQNHLQDTFVYIWNTLMGDFISPFFDAIDVIKKIVYKTDDFSDTELQVMRDDSYYIYPYISYILTGRQFPTDKPIQDTEEKRAKQNLYYLLFNGTSIVWPPKADRVHIVDNYVEEPAFPYLYLLLKYDSTQMFSCLNEAFEDSLLNDDEIVHNSAQDGQYQLKVSRQYIIEVLLGIFDASSDFDRYDKTLLAIFVARNYPKYSQLIRLSDTVLKSIIEDLCSYASEELKDDCELSLQSLLSVYKPAEFDSLISMFEEAGFYHALLSIYKTENKTIKLLELWIETSNQGSFDVTEELRENVDDSVIFSGEPPISGRPLGIFEMFESVPSMIARCLETAAMNPTEKAEIQSFIGDNFENFIRSYTAEIADIFSKYCPEVHEEVLKLGDSAHKYSYMKQIIETERTHKFNFVLSKEIKIAYIKQIIKMDPKSLTAYILTLSLDVVPIDDVLQILKSADAIDTIVELYKRDKMFEKAILQIIETMNDLGNSLIDDMSSSEDVINVKTVKERLWHYLFLGLSICETSHAIIDAKKKVKGNLTTTESLLLSLIEVPVRFFINTNKEIYKLSVTEKSSSSKSVALLEFCKRWIQDSFSALVSLCARTNFELVNKMEKNNSVHFPNDESVSNSFLNIFSEFLNRSSAKATTLGDVREVLKEIFLAYTVDSEIQKIILKLLNEDTYVEMLKYQNKQHAGYSIGNLDCEVCGKRIWGSGITKGVFEAWEDYKLLESGVINKEQVHDDETLKKLEIVTFSCKHGYHTKCLRGMGESNDQRYKCILCTSK